MPLRPRRFPPRAPGVRLALGAGRPRGMPPHPELCLRHSPFGGWGSSPLPPTWSPLTGSAHPQAAQWWGLTLRQGGTPQALAGAPDALGHSSIALPCVLSRTLYTVGAHGLRTPTSYTIVCVSPACAVVCARAVV